MSSGASDGKKAVVPTLTEPRYSQSVERGVAILMCFTPEKPMLGIADISDMLGMGRSTTHRYVITLTRLGFLEQPASGGRKYQLGPRVTDIGMAGLDSLSLRIEARPDLERLRERTAYTVNMGIIRDDSVLLVDRLRGFRGHAKLLPLNLGLASKLPLHGTSLGKVLLSGLSRQEYSDVLQRLVLTKLGPNTIATKSRLTSELAQVDKAGFAVNDEELAAGVRSIAMPVRLGESVIAAVDVVAPASMVERKELVDQFGPVLREATEAIAARLSRIDGAAK